MEVSFSRKTLYKLLTIILLAVYVILELFYLIADCQPLIIVNMINILLVATGFVLLGKMSTNQCFWFLYVDILSFTFLAVLLSGDAACYSVNLVPGVTLVCQWDYENKHITKTKKVSNKIYRYAIALIILIYLIEKGIDFFGIHFHVLTNTVISNYIHYFNFTVLIFTTLFSNIGWFYIVNRNSQKLEDDLQRSNYIANHDKLTGLKNRKSLENFIDRMESKNIDYSVIIADIDHFKSINDTYGHDCGDYILTEIGSILKNSIREEDRVYRWGGEEIVVVIPKTNVPAAKERAECVRSNIENYVFQYDKNVLHLTLTIGIASSNGRSFSDTLREADSYLYYGKEHGRNRVVCNDTLIDTSC